MLWGGNGQHEKAKAVRHREKYVESCLPQQSVTRRALHSSPNEIFSQQKAGREAVDYKGKSLRKVDDEAQEYVGPVADSKSRSRKTLKLFVSYLAFAATAATMTTAIIRAHTIHVLSASQ